MTDEEPNLGDFQPSGGQSNPSQWTPSQPEPVTRDDEQGNGFSQ